MRRVSFIGWGLLVLAAALTAAAQGADPRSVVEVFYRFDTEHSQVFNRRNIDSRKRWFTDVLNLHFDKELRREREYLRQNPTDKPHFGDGLPFQPLDETCKVGRRTYRYSYSIGNASMRGSNATVPVVFSYPKRCNLPATRYSVRLRRVKGVWRINDLEYSDGTTLLADLTRENY